MTWFKYRRHKPDAMARLFCLPFAGGSALTYRSWVDLAPHELDVCPVQLPGRDDRIAEPAYRRLPDLIDALVRGLKPHCDLPFGLFGHSMGARVVFELARALRSRGLPEPDHLFVSGSRAPHVPSGKPDLHNLSDAQLIEELRQMGGTPNEILDDEGVMAALLPILRADFELFETHRWTGDERVCCPITAFRGMSDPCASPEGTEAWKALTGRRFAMKTFPGNHFFLQSEGRAVLTEASVQLFRSLATGSL